MSSFGVEPKSIISSVSAEGAISAAPAPWTARAAISTPLESARPAASESTRASYRTTRVADARPARGGGARPPGGAKVVWGGGGGGGGPRGNSGPAKGKKGGLNPPQ